MSVVLITGSNGLVGSEASIFFLKKGYKVIGIDNNIRKKFFGNDGNTLWIKKKLLKIKNYTQLYFDIRNKFELEKLFKKYNKEINIVIHAAAQPSHDFAKNNIFLDFEINALGSLNIFNNVRRYCPLSKVIHLSTNKVYGDNPNFLKMKKLDSRWEYDGEFFEVGINETMSLDNCTHSLFGVSKTASDLLVQEYGRYFDIPTCCLRGGCLTGPSHAGVSLHGFLNFLIRCNLKNSKYTIFGYEGKQVRDNIHSTDVVDFIAKFIKKPKIASVYNIGGGYQNSISIIESFEKIENLTGLKMKYEYDDKARIGDHICYYSDLTKIKNDFDNWNVTKSLDYIFEDVYLSLKKSMK